MLMLEWLKDHLPVTRRRHHAEMEWQRETIHAETDAQTSMLLAETIREKEELRMEIQTLQERFSYGQSCQSNHARPLVALFGAGQYGREALGFFGQDTVLCFVDNMFDAWGAKIQEKTVLSPSELLQLYSLFSRQTEEQNQTKYDSIDFTDSVRSILDSNHFADETTVRFDVVISIGNPNAARFVAEQLLKMGIEDFSIYTDIRRRWYTGVDFSLRDRKLVPCEQETFLKQRSEQFDYLKRHADPMHLSPAEGSLRAFQKQIVQEAADFLGTLEEIGLSPFMDGGTLLGAVRHQGFIPWDDDLDFCLVYDEYLKLLAYCEENMPIYYYNGNGTWRKSDNQKASVEGSRFLAAIGFGYFRLCRNVHQAPNTTADGICDIFPLRYIDKAVTSEQQIEYRKKYFIRRKNCFDEVERLSDEDIIGTNIYVEKSDRLVPDFKWLSACDCWWFWMGRRFKDWIYPAQCIFPLKKKIFDGYEFLSPKEPLEYLKREYSSPLSLPTDFGLAKHISYLK